MMDVKVLLEELREESESGALATVTAVKRRQWPWAVAVAALAIVAVGGGLWLSRAREEPPPRVVPLTTFTGNEFDPAFSPDGNQVVFSWDGEKQDNIDLYVMMIGSATSLRLTTDPAVDRYPAWSRDGRRIAFLKFSGASGEHRGIYWISPLGGPEQKIADFDAAPGAPAWSPDGKFLVVAKYHPDRQPAADAGALFLVPVEDGEARPLLNPVAGRWYQYPAISSDGRSLALASCGGAGAAQPYCDVLVVRLNAHLRPQGKPRQFAAAIINLGVLTWTPDGRSLIYAGGSIAEGRFLYRVDVASGGEPKRLEIASRGAASPAVARNRLAFASSTNDTDVWRLEVGGKPQPLLVSTARDVSAQFSPDGRRIAFGSGRSGEGIAIWLANADGAGLVQLTRGPEQAHGSPNWSPDARWIAFDAQGKDGRYSIKVVEAGGGQARQLTTGPFSTVVPTWSHDGKWIYVGSDRSGRFEIWRIPFQGGAAEQVTRDGGYVARESPDGRTLYYTKTGGTGPLFSRLLDGDNEKQVLENVALRGFAVFEDGIYYLSSPSTTEGEIRFHEFATGRSRLVSSIEGRLFLYLSVSPDRKTFLFTLTAPPGSDLMLIENFR